MLPGLGGVNVGGTGVNVCVGVSVGRGVIVSVGVVVGRNNSVNRAFTVCCIGSVVGAIWGGTGIRLHINDVTNVPIVSSQITAQ